MARNDNESSNKQQATIKPELTKKILIHTGCDKRIPNETADAVSEVLRMFVIEARARATIEVRTYTVGRDSLEQYIDTHSYKMATFAGRVR